MSVIFDQYEERQNRIRRDRQTISNFRKARRHFERYLEDIGIEAEQVESWMMEEHFAALDLAPSTITTYYQQIRAAYEYAVTRRVLTANPARGVKLPRTPDKEPRIIPIKDLRAIKARAWTDRQWIIFHLLAYAGLRMTETRMLRGDDISIAEGTMRILGKGGKLRLVPIHPALGEALNEHCCVDPGLHVVRGQGQDGRLSEPIFYKEMRALSDTWTPHDYRRTVASSLARNGVPERVIDKIMGWAPRTVRDRYYVNVADSELQRAILKLHADDPV